MLRGLREPWRRSMPRFALYTPASASGRPIRNLTDRSVDEGGGEQVGELWGEVRVAEQVAPVVVPANP